MHNVTELFHGWKVSSSWGAGMRGCGGAGAGVYDYMKYCKHRYAKRQFRWKGADPNEDESIGEGIRSLDLMCFSSQYYFVLSFSSVALFILTISVQTLLRQPDRAKGTDVYNPFGDKMLPFIVIIVFIFCKIIHWCCVYI
eukprot:3694231-Rhodomonas_salina.1